jgi:SAM-dependent methyltransferase
MINPLRMYDDGLLRARDPERVGTDPRLRLDDGTTVGLPLDRYLGPADETDEKLLSGVRGPVLDVGCGPGRHLHALVQRGVFALGVDLSSVAVELATGRGARALVASIFDELPGSGTWRTALLLDGNIGIGGAPDRLLARVGTLLSDDGELLVELDPPHTTSGSTLVRIETDRGVSSWFPWARVSVCDLDRVARAGGFRACERAALGGRWFARLSRVG